MKKIKRYLLIFAILSIMLSNTLITTVNAVVMEESYIVATEAENLSGQNELQPMMANGCNLVKFSDSMANTVAQYHGFSGAEAFKQEFGVSSNGNMYKDTVSRQIYIVTANGTPIPTGYFGGWR